MANANFLRNSITPPPRRSAFFRAAPPPEIPAHLTQLVDRAAPVESPVEPSVMNELVNANRAFIDQTLAGMRTNNPSLRTTNPMQGTARVLGNQLDGLHSWDTAPYFRNVRTQEVFPPFDEVRTGLAQTLRPTSLADRVRDRLGPAGTLYTAPSPPPLEPIERVTANITASTPIWGTLTGTNTGNTGWTTHETPGPVIANPRAAVRFSDDVINMDTIRGNGNMHINSDNITMIDGGGNVRFRAGNLSSTPNPCGEIHLGNTEITYHLEPSYEKAILNFFKEKLNLKVSLAQAGKGFEIKVSLNVIDTDEEILSDSDYVEL